MKSGGLVSVGLCRSMFHADWPAMARRSLAMAPSKPQRDGMMNIIGFMFGLVVMGTMRPPSTTCGMSAMGVSAMAASADETMVDTKRPSAVALMASAVTF